MSKRISKHEYSIELCSSPIDYEELTVEIIVNKDPVNNTTNMTYDDGSTVKHSKVDFVALLQIEEGCDNVKIEFHERKSDLHLYLDEFLEAVNRAKKLLLNEK